MTARTLLIFRRDLRLKDHPAVKLALQKKQKIIALYLDDPYVIPSCHRRIGAASKWWLNKALLDLKRSIESLGGSLFTLSYDHEAGLFQKLEQIIKEYRISDVFFSQRFEVSQIESDRRLLDFLAANGINGETCNSSLLHDPTIIRTQKGEYYKVYTPFFQACQVYSQQVLSYAQEYVLYESIDHLRNQFCHEERDQVKGLQIFEPGEEPFWSQKFSPLWDVSEAGAHLCLKEFLTNNLMGYSENRDFPGLDHGTSYLSPYLHFGQISIHRVYKELMHLMHTDPVTAHHITFLKELYWREFCASIFFHSPNMTTKPFNRSYQDFWPPYYVEEKRSCEIQEILAKWQKGNTGIPIIDAGMRQLWQTGWMHNRVRMIVASFLVKHLFLHWRYGEEWFWDCLVDADPASNVMNWQWVAGCGVDAAPYFRIFNPYLQSQKFDSQGVYIRKYVPELQHISDKLLHKPLARTLQISYPSSMIDLDKARQFALQRHQTYKTTSS